jgi:uncharacterized membrane protein/peptidoglycan hydrolase-like protein with peptidoglycan-binding domain
MFIPAHDCHHRSAIKAVSWRALGSLDTFVLSYFITGSFVFAGSIASAETFTKVFLYYLHERAWSSLSWGYRTKPQTGQPRSAWARGSTASAAAGARVLALAASFTRPREFAATAALLVCFAAVVTPPSYLQNWAVPPTLSEWAPSPVVRGEVIEANRGVAVASPPVAMPARFDEAKANHRFDEQSAVADVAAHVTVAEVRADEPAETPHLTLAEQVPLPPIRSRDLSRADHAEGVQQKLAGLGFFSGSAIGIWGPRSRDALRAFKEAHDLGADDLWDEQTENLLFGSATKPSGNFVGVWAADVSACSAGSNRKGFVPAVIRFDGAQAGETICAFDTRKRTPGAWNVSATCSNGRERWKANVRLVADGNRLTWTSQRGTQTYVRCGSSMQMAGLH